MAKATKAKKTKLEVVTNEVESVASAPEVNEFENPEAALETGSATQMAVLDGNDIEAPAEAEQDSDPVAEEARERLKKVFTEQDRDFYEIAKDMSYIANKKAYQQWGFKTFESFLDAEFKMGKRKGQYYVQVYNYFHSALRTTLSGHDSSYNDLMDTIRRVGWTKGRVLAREQVITTDNVEEVIGKLDSCGYRELETYCKSLRDSMDDADREEADDNNDMKTVRVAFQCSLPQKNDIEAAIDLASTMIGKETTRSGAIAWVARDFVSTNVAAQGKDRAGMLAETLSKFERLFGVSIIAIDEETKACVYGGENMERLAQ